MLRCHSFYNCLYCVCNLSYRVSHPDGVDRDQFSNMKSSAKPKATEKRLDEIREAALQAGPAQASAQAGESYYGLPLLKAPVWSWPIPLYFFLGGISGVSACIGFVAQLFHSDPALVRVCLWIGLIGASICPMLLIADLGRPARFLNMLRVFKLQSAMSMGAWILVVFSNFAFLAVLCFELVLRGFTNPLLISVLWLLEAAAAITGLLLASYTGVLIGATAIPVWSQNRELLPAHFLILRPRRLNGNSRADRLLDTCDPDPGFRRIRDRDVDRDCFGSAATACRCAFASWQIGNDAPHRGISGGSCGALAAGFLGRFPYGSLRGCRLFFTRVGA